MNTSPCTKLFALALIGALASCAGPSAAVSHVPVSSRTAKSSSLSNQVFREVNSYRASKGKAALERHPGLDHLAKQHCDYLVKNGGKFSLYGSNVSHIGLQGRGLIARQAYKIRSIGENVVSSHDQSPTRLVSLWADSEGHEYNMSADWACTGVATAITPDGRVISTQIFGVAPAESLGGRGDPFRQW
jgi:uncharacterized protein YkwD